MSEPSLYAPMVDVLEETLGVTFQLWDTGGGCTALVGYFGTDTTVMITDSAKSPNGHEATITDQPTRDRLDREQPALVSTVGFAIGVYRDAGDTQIAYADHPMAHTAELPDLVMRELIEALETRIRVGGERCAGCYKPIDYSGELTRLDVQVWKLNRATGEKKVLCPDCGAKLQKFLQGGFVA